MPHESKCSPREIQNYLGRISGPLLDRVDLHIEVPAVKFREMTSERLMAKVASTQFIDAVASSVLSVSYLCAVAIAVWGMASRNKRRVIFTLGWLVVALVGPAMLIGIVGVGLLKLTSSGFVAPANLIHGIGWIGMISPFACAVTVLLFGMTGHLPGTQNPVRKMAV